MYPILSWTTSAPRLQIVQAFYKGLSGPTPQMDRMTFIERRKRIDALTHRLEVHLFLLVHAMVLAISSNSGARDLRRCSRTRPSLLFTLWQALIARNSAAMRRDDLDFENEDEMREAILAKLDLALLRTTEDLKVSQTPYPPSLVVPSRCAGVSLLYILCDEANARAMKLRFFGAAHGCFFLCTRPLAQFINDELRLLEAQEKAVSEGRDLAREAAAERARLPVICCHPIT